MGELFGRYFALLAGRLPGAEYGVIATPADVELFQPVTAACRPERLCSGF